MGIFEVLASQDASEHERVAGTRAVIAAQTRAKERFEKFVSKAANQEERDARINVIAADLDEIVKAISEEYGYGDVEKLRNAATVALGGGHPSGCECGFCKNKGKLPGSDKEEQDESEPGAEGNDEPDERHDYEASVKLACPECTEGEECEGCRSKKTSRVDVLQSAASAAEFPWDHVASVHVADGFSHCDCDCEGCDEGNHCESEKCIESKHSGNPGNPESAKSSEKTAADAETGDSFSQERVDLPSSKDGLGGPSPKIDKGKSGDNTGWDLKPIEVPSAQHPTEQQHIHDTPDYSADLPGVTETGKRIDADSALAPELYAGDNTETWSGTENQAAPVTSEVLSKWTVAT